MSQPCLSDYHQPQCYSSSSGDEYQVRYNDTGARTSPQTTNNSSTLAQTYLHSDLNFITDNSSNACSSYDFNLNYPAAHHPDSSTDTEQRAPAIPVLQDKLEAPCDTVPNYHPQTLFEHRYRSPDAHHGLDNRPTGQSCLAHITSVVQPRSPPPELRLEPVYSPAGSPGGRSKGLQVLECGPSAGHLGQVEATRRRLECFTIQSDQNPIYTLAHDNSQHIDHQAHRRYPSSSRSVHEPPSTSNTLSHNREPAAFFAFGSPRVEETPAAKPALACTFCRKRKIPCGISPGSIDHACNQCLRRKQSCEYPITSRHGVYTLDLVV